MRSRRVAGPAISGVRCYLLPALGVGVGVPLGPGAGARLDLFLFLGGLLLSLDGSGTRLDLGVGGHVRPRLLAPELLAPARLGRALALGGCRTATTAGGRT